LIVPLNTGGLGSKFFSDMRHELPWWVKNPPMQGLNLHQYREAF
jgi:hypothetical protein